MPVHPSSPPSPEKCPNCGAPLPERAPQGLCPKCLFAGLAVPTEDGAAPSGTAHATLTPEQLAPHFPQLEILECLGRGGMGVVYKARQKSLNRLVALKLLAPERADDPQFAGRFEREAQALAALTHPHIVAVHDFGVVDAVSQRPADAVGSAPVPHAKMFFLLMEFVDGVNLRQAMKAGRFTPEQALAVVPPVCEALQYAHEHGIVHRDIKPENLLLDKEGRVKIADFGIAKMLGGDATGALPDQPSAESPVNEGTLASAAGTPQYMAPEQKAHRATDHRADIYSLGVVLYELLTGELPADKLQPPSRKVQIDVRLDEIVLRALEAQPERRYQTAGEFRTQLVTMTGGANVPPVQPSVAVAPFRFSRPAIVGACWMLAFPLMVVAWVSIMGEHSNRHAVPWYVFDPGGPLKWWVNLVVLILFPLGITAPLATTILGWISVTQIRRSAGKLYGLGLAVFDGLLFPLLALDGLIGWLLKSLTQLFVELYMNEPMRQRALSDPEHIHLGFVTRLANTLAHNDGMVAFVLIVAAFVVDVFIVRWVWRAVNKSSANSSATAPAAPHESANSPLAYVAIFFACLPGVLGVVTFCLWPAPPQMLVWAILVSALLGIFVGIPARKFRLGRKAMVIGGIQTAVWLIIAVFGPRVALDTPSPVSASSDLSSFVPMIEREIPFGRASLNFATGILTPFPGMPLAAEARRLHGDVFQPATESNTNALAILDARVLDLDDAAWTNLSATALEEKFAQDAASHRTSQGQSQTRIPPGIYGFKTHDKTGLLQVLGMTGSKPGEFSGVMLRYKLSQSATKTAAVKPVTGDGKPTFGPVIEREVVEAIDFDTGKLANSLPDLVTKSNDIAQNVMAAISWMEHEGMDAVTEPSSELKGVGLKAKAADKEAWDHFTPDQIVSTLAAAKRETWQDLDPNRKTDEERKTPATWVFETREGRKGILQLLEHTEHGVKLRYKLVQDAMKTGAATSLTWSPTHAPGVKPDLQQIYAEAQELRAHGRYEEALQRHLWLHHHALETDPGYSAVRLSFWLADWAELARRYPNAKQALMEIRDLDTQELSADRGHLDLFMDVDRINAYFQDEAATLALFKQIEQSDPQLAKQCAIVMESLPKGRKKNTPPPAAVPAPDDSISLTQAVNDFNKRHHVAAAVAKQPDLTVEAVLAAIHMAMQDRPNLSVTNATFAALGRMTVTQVLPKGFELELLTSYEDDQATKNVWSVRLRIPGTVVPNGTTCISIHEQLLSTHVIGEEERKVIRAWREKERKQGGIGSFERAEWGSKEREERDAAAAIDAKQKSAAIADPLPAIELKVAQQQLEKVLGDLLETQAALAIERSEKNKTHPAVMKLEAKLKVLEEQAAQLRVIIQQSATKP